MPDHSPEEQAVRARIQAAELDRQHAAAQLDAMVSGTKLMGGFAWSLIHPNVAELRAQETEAVTRRTAALAELAALEGRSSPTDRP
jgi:hypothetical protein